MIAQKTNWLETGFFDLKGFLSFAALKNPVSQFLRFQA